MTHHAPPLPRSGLRAAAAPSVVMGFAIAVAMWTIGFYLRIPGAPTPAPLIATLLALTLLAGCVVAGRAAPRGGALVYGAGAGFVAGVINLLVLFSLVADADSPNSLHGAWPLVLSGWMAFCVVVGVVGGMIGARSVGERAPAHDRADWHARFAVVAAVAVFPLITIGGLVTSKQAGLAVPDWPNTYGSNMFLFPLSRMTGGIYYEHAHRLFGSLVGLTTLAFMVHALLADRRGRYRALVVGAFVLVVVQGVLGGLRVTGKPTLAQEGLEPNTALAVVHGVTGQAFFALMCVIAAMATRLWKSDAPAQRATIDGSPRLLTSLFLIVLFVQVILGAVTRHFADSPGYMHSLMTHLVNSLLVTAVAIGVGVRAPSAIQGVRALRFFGTGVMHGTLAQMVLGVATLFVVLAHRGSADAAESADPPLLRTIIATAHQTMGAVLLAFGALAWAWSRRLVLPRRSGTAADRTRPMPGGV